MHVRAQVKEKEARKKAEAQKLAAQEAKVSDLVKALVNVPLDSHIGRC